jgi:2-oxoglutarate dehydrogenase E2 component (dihydrolipoamide succinyltransferase)
MTTKVIMPQLGESVVEGTVTKWLIEAGQVVEEYQPLVEINTDKVDTEIPSPASGTLLHQYVDEGQTVRAGTLLAVIGQPGEEIPEASELEPISAEPVEPEFAGGAELKSPPTTKVRIGRREDLGFISPVVAKISAEHGIDLHHVQGTGRAGRITKKDLLSFLESRETTYKGAPWEQPASGELFRPTEEVFGDPLLGVDPSSAMQVGSIVPLDAIRSSIAEHMVRSKDTSPHVTTVMEADMTRVIADRNRKKTIFERDGVRLTYTAYFTLAAVDALKAVPIVNASWSSEGIVLHQQIHIGIAVSLGEAGLIVPVVKDVDQKSLLAAAQSINDLAERARGRKLMLDEVQGGTFTITNHGVTGSLFATPIINQPQAAILGVGALQKRVVVEQVSDRGGEERDVIAIRPMVYLTLTFDHRILDGAIADRFLGVLVNRLESWS